MAATDKVRHCHPVSGMSRAPVAGSPGARRGEERTGDHRPMDAGLGAGAMG
jgi:hypothetical protein